MGTDSFFFSCWETWEIIDFCSSFSTVVLMYTHTASSYCALLLIYMGPTLIFGQLLSCSTLQATAGVIDFQSSDINLRLPLRYPHHRPPLLSRSSSSQEEEERGHGRNASVQSMRRCDCTLGGIKGGGREGGRRRRAGEAWKEEAGRKWMDEKQVECALLPPFAWMGSVRRTTVCCVRWWVVFRGIMSMCGSQQQEWESGIDKTRRRRKKRSRGVADISRHPLLLLRPASLVMAGATAPPTGGRQ